MPKLYFQKELPDRPVVLAGRRLTFEFLELDDSDPLVPLLRDCVRKVVGGVKELTEEQYAASKKLKLLPKKSLSGFPREEVKEKSFQPNRGEVARYAVKDEPKPAPIDPAQSISGAIDFTQFKPNVAKGVYS